MISWFHDLLDFCFYADKVFARGTRKGILSTQRLMITQKESTRYETLRSKWFGKMLNNQKEIGQRNESSCIFIIWKYLQWNAFFSFVFSFVGASCHASGPDYPLLGFKPERPFSFGSFKNLFTLLLLLKTMLTIFHQIGQIKILLGVRK